ncbi:Mss4-like protein [Collybia nuda]|uniref:Mss4-like protein n=1 Tax=Collybia nuda TaxID=64659 RepID=A0A9P5XYD7_9AGAR|nr:Mss4-like protein [Collybia nuda]
MANTVRHGSCLCKRVKYEVTGDPWAFFVCHCGNCKKMTGSAFMANSLFKPEQYKITEGEDLITQYRDTTTNSGKPKILSFCSKCGSPIRITNEAQLVMVAPTGTYDDEIPWDPTNEFYLDRKRKWIHEITTREDGCVIESI